ncbi:hypothetical protein NDU88_005572 [Pleurodeles waltl]|uniref:Uncharacterized protein n=1 Tax=Pleurodeles waltl TaxID=8319 RepID=A0AAV7WVL8_PLEWA|nr:hypothetical protein NDU88_005572 [Pleurodeles waltl]
MGGFQPSTSDLHWQEGEDLGGGEPGEQSAARGPRQEEKAEPRVAGRMSSAEVQTRRQGAVDAPRGQCGGMGFVPAGVAVPREQGPGPSGMQRGPQAPYTEAAMSGELQQQVFGAAGLQEQDELGDEECKLDFDERSIEEGELSEGWEEEEWWADRRGEGLLLILLLSRFRGQDRVIRAGRTFCRCLALA